MAKQGEPKGVRGPRGPQRPTSGRTPANARPTTSPARATLERLSTPLLARMHALPRWIMVVLPAVVLLAGLVLTGDWGWLGALALLLVAVFLGWLLALSWPVLNPGSRLIRGITVLAVAGLAYFKATGRF